VQSRIVHKGSLRLGNYLHRLRTGYGYSMRRVGERARAEGGEIDNSQLSRYEKGICYPSFEKLRVLASVFNVSVQSFSDMVDLETIEPIGGDDAAGPEELVERGDEALRRGDNGTSFACFERALDLLTDRPTSMDRRRAIARVRTSQAVALTRLGRLALAEHELRKALALDDALERDECVRALLALANIQADRGELLLAQIGAQQAAEMARSAGSKRLEGMALHTLGRLLADRGRHVEAIDRFRQAQEIYRRCGEAYERLRLRINIGSCFVALDKHREGNRLLRAALQRARREGHRRLEALGWSSLGEACFRRGEHARARQCLRQSTTLASYNAEKHPDLLFYNAYYQWRIARESDNAGREKAAFGRLKVLRSRLERTFREVRAFDRIVKGGLPSC
jgi:tetratricopeptide (TPR) repeat protein